MTALIRHLRGPASWGDMLNVAIAIPIIAWAFTPAVIVLKGLVGM